MYSLITIFFTFFMTFFLIALVFAIIALVANYKLYEKAGVEGWKSLIPFYNVYVATVDIAKLDVIWFILLFLAFIPFIGGLVAAVAGINIIYSICRRFTPESDLRIIATILYGIFVFIFAFGNFKYDNGTYSRNGFFNDSTVDNIKSGFTGGSGSTSSSESTGSVNFCKNCGNKVKPGEKFCDNCGNKL